VDANLFDLEIYSGTALLENGSKQAQVKMGRKIRLDVSLSQSKFDPKAKDALAQWSAHKSFDIFLANAESDNWKWMGLMPTAYNPNPSGFFANPYYRVRFKAKMPPQYARRLRAVQGIDGDQVRKETEDRIKNDERIEQEKKNKEVRDILEKINH
jgi:hypothetical protein